MKTLKTIQWKAVVSGIIVTLIISMVFTICSSLIADLIIFKIHKQTYTFSLFSKNDSGLFSFTLGPGSDPSAGIHYTNFYDKWFPLITIALFFLSSLIGGHVAGRIAKTKIALHGIITGTITGLIFLSWLAPLGVAASYIGAVEARRRKVNEKEGET